LVVAALKLTCRRSAPGESELGAGTEAAQASNGEGALSGPLAFRSGTQNFPLGHVGRGRSGLGVVTGGAFGSGTFGSQESTLAAGVGAVAVAVPVASVVLVAVVRFTSDVDVLFAVGVCPPSPPRHPTIKLLERPNATR
jgi:hypothetical protein